MMAISKNNSKHSDTSDAVETARQWQVENFDLKVQNTQATLDRTTDHG